MSQTSRICGLAEYGFTEVLPGSGTEFWQQVLQAGFTFCAVHCLEYPSGLAI